MIEEKDLFVEGERRLGRYTVVILRQSDNGCWMPSIMQLDATVTNYRLLLRPHRKKYEPASLPAPYIKTVDMSRRGNYHCVQIKLLTDQLLFLMLSTGKLDDLHDDLKAMKAPPPKFSFDEKVAKHDIERLITFFGKEPLEEDGSST